MMDVLFLCEISRFEIDFKFMRRFREHLALSGEVFWSVHALDKIKFETFFSLLTSEHRRLVSREYQ